MRRGVLRLSLALTAVLTVTAGLLVGLAPVAQAAPTAPGAFVPSTPSRVLDTRTGVGAPRAAVAPGGTLTLFPGPVPASAGAVLLNVTVTNTRAPGYVTAWPDGTARPTASNLNFVAGQTVPNLVAVRLGRNGAVALFNGSGGTVDLVADLAGYYLKGTPTAPGAFTSLAPQRLLDTRTGNGVAAGPVGGGGTVSVKIAGRGGIPASGVSAVLLNVTATDEAASGYVTAYPGGTDRPTASSLNFVTGRTIANLVAVPVDTNGSVSLYNGSGGRIDLIGDVAGYYVGGTPTLDGMFASLPPARLLDTRSGLGAPRVRVPTGGVVHLQATGADGIPTANVVSVLLNVTVATPSASGYLTVYPDGAIPRPTASNLNFAAGQTVANLVSVRVGTGGKVALYNGGGSADLIADVAGYVLGPGWTAAPPPVTDPFASKVTPTSVVLGWTNPASSPTFTGVLVRRAVGSVPPATPTDGTGEGDLPPAQVSLGQGGLLPNTTYSWSLFAHDGLPNYAPPATITVTTPVGPPAAVIGLGSVDWTKNAVYDKVDEWADPDVVRLYPNAAGDLGLATFHPSSSTITVQSFDPSTLTAVGSTKSVALGSWPIYGGMYAAPDGSFFVALGRNNPNMDDDLDVVTVRHYDPNWNLVGSAFVQGGASQGIKGVYTPFAQGAAHMVLDGDELVLHMSRLAYAVDADGQHVQADLTVQVDVPTMTATPFADLGGYPFSSSSFQQLVTMSGDDLVLLDHGDDDPRAMEMTVMANYPTSRLTTSTDLLPLDGTPGDPVTGATLTGVASGPSGILAVGTSVRQSAVPPPPVFVNGNRNVYVVAADPATGAHTFQWLSAVRIPDHVDEPRIVQVAPDRFAVLFTNKAGGQFLDYVLMDSSGTVVARTSFEDAQFLAGTDPVLVGNRILWAGQVGGTGYVYGLDVTDPTHPELITP